MIVDNSWQSSEYDTAICLCPLSWYNRATAQLARMPNVL